MDPHYLTLTVEPKYSTKRLRKSDNRLGTAAQFETFACPESVWMWFLRVSIIKRSSPEIPTAFRSLEEARNSFDYLCNLCIQKSIDFEHIQTLKSGNESQEHRAAWDRDRQYQKNQCSRWSDAFQAFLNTNVGKMDSKAMRGAMVLKMSLQVMYIHLDVSAFAILHDQSCWDELLPKYVDQVDIAESILDAAHTAEKDTSVKPIFQMDSGIIPPLFTVIHKCRDPYVRRRALALLNRVPRQEGIWNSHLTARCAERIIKIEEEGLGEVKCCADVPDWARISDVQVTFDQRQRRGFITYSRLRSFHSTVREPITDVLEW
ncbi:MAG: hypothetical protein Q9207_006616 [Kuettlingeria erythrocarpa]